MIEEDKVRELAYHFWCQRGRPEGSPEIDWQAATTQLTSYPDAQTVKQSQKLRSRRNGFIKSKAS